MTRQETIDKAVSLAVKISDDQTHGYDQAKRWGPDYDCASFLITVWQDVGVPVKSAGATYTGNMYKAFLKCGFKDVIDKINLVTGYGLQKGDVLLNKGNHTEMYIGNGKVVKASINENGKITGGKEGDQSGREIYVGNYYNYPWDCVLRYEGNGAESREDEIAKPCSVSLPVLRLGCGMGDKKQYKPWVKSLQILLIGRYFSCGGAGADGEFGNATDIAVRNFQTYKNVKVDGIVGNDTWNKLMGGD